MKYLIGGAHCTETILTSQSHPVPASPMPTIPRPTPSPTPAQL